MLSCSSLDIDFFLQSAREQTCVCLDNVYSSDTDIFSNNYIDTRHRPLMNATHGSSSESDPPPPLARLPPPVATY